MKKTDYTDCFLLIIIFIIVFAVVLSACFSVEKSLYITAVPSTENTTKMSTTKSSTTYKTPDAPYKGLPESKINSTMLGTATEVKKCKDFYKLQERARYTEYKWVKNGVTVFKATVRYWDYKNGRAVPGYVSNITDWRSTATATYNYTTKKHTTTTDPYNAKDYDDEEAFYEDHYDDFFDYYDAEDYYREHHD